MYYKECRNKNDVIDAIARDTKLRDEIIYICRTSDPNKIDDLLQELYEILLGKDDELIMGLNERNELKFYIIRIIMSQYFSKSSKYYRLFVRNNIHNHRQEISEKEETNDILSNVVKAHYKVSKLEDNKYHENSNIEAEVGWGKVMSEMSFDEYMENQAEENKIENEAKLLVFINEELAKMDWYDRDIFLLYHSKKTSFTKLSKELNISRNSLFNTVTKVKEKLLKRYNIRQNEVNRIQS